MKHRDARTDSVVAIEARLHENNAVFESARLNLHGFARQQEELWRCRGHGLSPSRLRLIRDEYQSMLDRLGKEAKDELWRPLTTTVLAMTTTASSSDSWSDGDPQDSDEQPSEQSEGLLKSMLAWATG